MFLISVIEGCIAFSLPVMEGRIVWTKSVEKLWTRRKKKNRTNLEKLKNKKLCAF